MANGPVWPKGSSSKNLTDFKSLGRGPFTSMYRRLAAETGLPPNAQFFNRLAAFTGQFRNWKAWFVHLTRYFGEKKYPFPSYPPPQTGIYKVPNELTLSIAGDWGTGTDEADNVTQRMAAREPHYTIHLGDVYYIGDLPELEQNCLNQQTDPRYKPVKWEHGTLGSFALNGNHEMYALGGPYFNKFLPTLGPKNADPRGQKASYFCLENDYWKVIAIDTGYNSTGPSSLLSFLSGIKFIKCFRKSSCFKPSSKLPDELLEWLPSATAVGPRARKPGLILLSHHEYYSGFEDWYVKPAEQLKPYISRRAVLWFWGHEHRMAIYKDFATQNGINAFGRCIGHGGMPVKRGVKPDIDECGCVVYDDRRYSNDENIDVGYNGYIHLTFDADTLRVDYYDVYDKLLLTETWIVDPQGELNGPTFSSVSTDRGFIQNDPNYIRQHS